MTEPLVKVHAEVRMAHLDTDSPVSSCYKAGKGKSALLVWDF